MKMSKNDSTKKPEGTTFYTKKGDELKDQADEEFEELDKRLEEERKAR